jgi:hypothetical protein
MVKRFVQIIKGFGFFLAFIYLLIFIWERLPVSQKSPTSEQKTQVVQPTALGVGGAGGTALKPTVRPTQTEVPIRVVELKQAIKDGIAVFEAIGDGLEALDLILDSLSDEDVRIEVEPGTIFRPGNASTQSMVVRRRGWIDLPANGHAERELDVACANMHKGTPGSDDSFSIDFELSPGDLVDLLDLIEFHEENFRVQQFAIWTITDNPAPNRYVGLGYFGAGSGPSEEELDRIYALFLTAGIQTDQYRALMAYPTPTPLPSATLAPIDLENCIAALEITPNYIGQTVCAYGIVAYTFQGEGYTSLSFSKARDEFYLLSYDVDLRVHSPGACVRAVGEVKELRGIPLILVGYKNPVELCP